MIRRAMAGGLGGTGGDWGVLATFVERTLVCRYDRLNVGQSHTVPLRHTGLGSVRDLDFYATLDEAEPLLGTVPDIPITYLAARPVDLPAWPVEEMRAFIAARQAEFVDRYPSGRLVEVQSSHDIDLEHPEIVVMELERILAAG